MAPRSAACVGVFLFIFIRDWWLLVVLSQQSFSMAEVKVTVSPEEERLIKKRLITQTTTARPGADPPVKKLAKK